MLPFMDYAVRVELLRLFWGFASVVQNVIRDYLCFGVMQVAVNVNGQPRAFARLRKSLSAQLLSRIQCLRAFTVFKLLLVGFYNSGQHIVEIRLKTISERRDFQSVHKKCFNQEFLDHQEPFDTISGLITFLNIY